MDKQKIVGGAVGAALAVSVPLIARWEGKRNDPYYDIVGVRTVCYGETRVEMRRYTDAECTDMLRKAVAQYQAAVLKCTPTLADWPYQLAAATSLAYNIGPAAYCGSQAAARFRAGDFKGACDAFLSWRNAGGKFSQGLYNRRVDERRICLTGIK